MGDAYADKWPKCATPGCTGRIYLRPEERTVCAACEKQGLAAATELPPLPEANGAKRV